MADETATISMLMFVSDMMESSSDDTDDSDDVYRVVPSLYLALEREDKTKILHYAERVVPLYNMDDFRRFFRTTRGTFEIICQQLGTCNELITNSSGRPAVGIEKQLMVFLWYIGSLEPLCRIADRFNVTEFTVLRIRQRMCDVILNHFMKKYIIWPKAEERQEIIRSFQDKRGFPDVLGAIDSTHIQIRPPSDHPQDYVNRKGYHSIDLQVVCREDMRFIDCYTGWPGSCHDTRVLKNSSLFENGSALCGNAHIIGDGGFPLKQWLLTPFRDNGHLTPVQRHYNLCLSSTRQVVERSFSLLKGRFRRLQNVDVQSVETDVMIIMSCCVIHNICILNEDILDDFFIRIIPWTIMLQTI